MAIGQNFLTGRMKGSAGGTRFSTWRGLNVIASKPIEVRQNVTAAVELNRSKMSVVAKAISKINANTKSIYSLGIAKTTPFADTVKFFRNRLLDTLKLDPVALSAAKFGTGNAEGHTYSVLDYNADQLTLDRVAVSNVFDTSQTNVDVLVVSDDMKKIVYLPAEGTGDGNIIINLLPYGFDAGDKVAVATKPIRSRPGTDLCGTVKFVESATFIALT